jgi:hypothetical protein
MRSLMSVLAFLLVVFCSPVRSAPESVPTRSSTPNQAVQRLITALNERDAAAFEAIVDIDALAERAMRELELSEEERAGVARGMRQAGGRLAGNVLALVRHNNSRILHLRSQKREGQSSSLLRFDHFDAVGDSAGTDYVEYDFGADGRVVDWYSHGQGERLSDAMGRLLALMMPREGLLARIFGISEVDKDLALVFRRMGEQQRAADYAGAYATLGEVQGALRETRLWAVMRVTMATNAGDELRRESLKYLFDHFGEASDLQFLLIDYHFENGDFGAVVSALESFEQAVVEDEVTTQLKCIAASHGQQWPQAQGFCERSLQIEPSLKNTWWLLIDIGRQTDDVDLVLTTLAGYERQFEVQFDPDLLVEDEAYAWLKSKPEFKKWAALRRE